MRLRIQCGHFTIATSPKPVKFPPPATPYWGHPSTMTTAIPSVQSGAVHQSSLTQKLWNEKDAFSADSFPKSKNHSVNLQLSI